MGNKQERDYDYCTHAPQKCQMSEMFAFYQIVFILWHRADQELRNISIIFWEKQEILKNKSSTLILNDTAS